MVFRMIVLIVFVITLHCLPYRHCYNSTWSSIWTHIMHSATVQHNLFDLTYTLCIRVLISSGVYRGAGHWVMSPGPPWQILDTTLFLTVYTPGPLYDIYADYVVIYVPFWRLPNGVVMQCHCDVTIIVTSWDCNVTSFGRTDGRVTMLCYK